jgi:hypothetical protein
VTDVLPGLFRRDCRVSVPLDTDLDAVIDGLDEILFGAEVAFGGLDGGMTEEQLNLFQFPARLPAQLGAGAS